VLAVGVERAVYAARVAALARSAAALQHADAADAMFSRGARAHQYLVIIIIVRGIISISYINGL